MPEYMFAETAAAQKAAVAAIEAARGDLSSPICWDDVKAALQKEIKKRGAPQVAITSVVDLVFSYTQTEEFDKDVEVAKDVMQFIADLTDGKIFVETARARTVKRLSAYLEKEGDIEGAKKLIQDLQVEAYSSMQMEEKLTFILDQMRLVHEVRDFVRVQITSRKIRPRTLNVAGFEKFKMRYYQYLVQYHLHERDYLEVSKCFKELICFATQARALAHREENKENKVPGWEGEHELYVISDAEAKQIVGNCCVFNIMAAPGEERDAMMKEMLDKALLKDFPSFENMIKMYMSKELVDWPLQEKEAISSLDLLNTQEYAQESNRFESLRKAFLLRNYVCLSKYFTEVSFEDIKTLCSVSDQEEEEGLVNIEEEMAKAICHNYVKGKIDRPNRLVRFGNKKTHLDLINEARLGMRKSQEMVAEATLLIQRERLIYTSK